MNTADAIRQRRAVKHFDPAHEMPKETFDQLMELVMQSPTSFNIQQWRFGLSGSLDNAKGGIADMSARHLSGQLLLNPLLDEMLKQGLVLF